MRLCSRLAIAWSILVYFIWTGLAYADTPRDPRFPLRVNGHLLTKAEFKALLKNNADRMTVLRDELSTYGFQPQFVNLGITARTTQAELAAMARRAQALDNLLDLVFSFKNFQIPAAELKRGLLAQRYGQYDDLADLIKKLEHELSRPGPTVTVTTTPSAIGTPTASPAGQPPVQIQPAPSEPQDYVSYWPISGLMLIILILTWVIVSRDQALRQASVQIKTLTDSLHDMAKEATDWRQRASAAENKNRRLETALRQAEAASLLPPEVDLENTITALQNKIRALEIGPDGSETLAAIVVKRDMLARQVEKLQAENRRLSDELATERSLVHDNQERIRHELKEKDKIITQLTEELRQARSGQAVRHELALEEIERREQEINELRSQISELRTRLQKFQQLVDDRGLAVSDQLSGLNSEIRTHQETIEAMRQQFNELEVFRARAQSLEPLTGYVSIVDQAHQFGQLPESLQQAIGSLIKILAQKSASTTEKRQLVPLFTQEIIGPSGRPQKITTLAQAALRETKINDLE